MTADFEDLIGQYDHLYGDISRKGSRRGYSSPRSFIFRWSLEGCLYTKAVRLDSGTGRTISRIMGRNAVLNNIRTGKVIWIFERLVVLTILTVNVNRYGDRRQILREVQTLR